MFDNIIKNPQKIIVIGDVFVSPDIMEAAVRNSNIAIGEIIKTFWSENDKEVFTSMQLNVEKNGPEAEKYADGVDEYIEEADILITHFCPIPRMLIEKAKNLKMILTCRGGLEHICIDAASKKNIPVINVIRNSEPVADFTLGLIYDVTRNISLSHHKLIEGSWVKEYPNSDNVTILSELTIGLAGLGNIGIELALKLKALGVNIIAYDKYVSLERLEKNSLGNIELVQSLDDLFKKADVISLHLRLTKDTEKIIDKKYFSLMKPTAYFVNTARGGLVNQKDLIEALRNHSIAGAALDVFEYEPIDENTGFRDLNNIVITPHIAGTTVDAIPKSPYLLMKEVDKIITLDITERIINYKEIDL